MIIHDSQEKMKRFVFMCKLSTSHRFKQLIALRSADGFFPLQYFMLGGFLNAFILNQPFQTQNFNT